MNFVCEIVTLEDLPSCQVARQLCTTFSIPKWYQAWEEKPAKERTDVDLSPGQQGIVTFSWCQGFYVLAAGQTLAFRTLVCPLLVKGLKAFKIFFVQGFAIGNFQ